VIHPKETFSALHPQAISPARETAALLPHSKRPLRILVAHNVSRQPNGGMSRLMTFIHDRLADSGHVVDYFCAEDVPQTLSGRLSRFSFPILVLRHAARAAREGRPYDLVNVHEPSSAAMTAFKTQAGNPVVVVTSYGVERRGWHLALEELRLKRQAPSLKTRLLYPSTSLWQSTIGLRRADHIFCSNAEDLSFLCEQMNLPQSKITRIHSAADSVFSEAAQGRSYERCERLLFAATWRKNKGIEDLVPAFVALAARHPRLELIVLGGGVPADAVLEAFPPHVRGRIKCVQASSDAGTAAEFARADLFLLPSLFEGTPLTLIEAMASGLPIVTTATCGMKDVILDGVNGLLVPIRSPDAIVNAVERLLKDERLRAELGSNAREDALEKYTWKHVAAPVRVVYERLCEARGAQTEG
jgi:glycosyltransferase involved in cell wall biosynthesis